MRRPARKFQSEPIALEGRRLLASHRAVADDPSRAAIAPVDAAASPPEATAPVQFDAPYNFPSIMGGTLTQFVSQQAGSATLTLLRPDTAGVLQARVTESLLSAGAGVNAGPVDQTVTFADGQSQATVTIPITSGAPNPGVVDVVLGVEPVDAPPPPLPLPKGSTLDLKVVAADPAARPKVTSVADSGRGLLLTFNKPMDPAAADDVANYSVVRTASEQHGGLFGFGTHTVTVSSPVQIRAAQYDAASQTVLLVPRNLHFGTGIFTTLKLAHRERTAARPGHPPHAARGLVDLQGHPINAASDPGKVAVVIKDATFFL